MSRFESQVFQIADVRVPVKRRKTLDADKVAALAQTLLDEGQKVPILLARTKMARAMCWSKACTAPKR